jgi:hypothetical protein
MGHEQVSAERFLRGLTARTVLLLVATAGLNYLVNPFGNYATHLFEPIVLRSRLPKLALYEQRLPAPDIVVLGSSRSFTMEPSYIEAKTARRAFNAGVHGATPRDYLDLARCFAAHNTFPSVLIVGLGVEQLVAQPALVERHDPLANCRSSEARSTATFVRTYRGLFTIEETWASLRVLALEQTGRPAPAYRFAADGMMEVLETRPLEEAVDRSLAGNWRPSQFDSDSLHPTSVALMRQFLELCRERQARVVIYLPPYQPRAMARYLEESRLASLRVQVLDQLMSWAKEYPLEFYDFTEVSRFGGRADMFYDASHPREDAYRLMLDLMLDDLG